MLEGTAAPTQPDAMATTDAYQINNYKELSQKPLCSADSVANTTEKRQDLGNISIKTP